MTTLNQTKTDVLLLLREHPDGLSKNALLRFIDHKPSRTLAALQELMLDGNVSIMKRKGINKYVTNTNPSASLSRQVLALMARTPDFMTCGAIARALGHQPSVVYSHLNKLVANSIVSKINISGTTHYVFDPV